MYSTGTASTAANMLQALATFATSAGWTVDNSGTEASGYWLALHKGSTYIDLWSDAAGANINCYGATGFSVGGGHAGQANTSPVVICNITPGPYTGYHFFSSTSGTYLHVVVEVSAGLFSHIHVGTLLAAGGASPCTYVEVTNWSTLTGGNGQNYPDSTFNAAPWGANPVNNGNGAGCVACTVDGNFRWFRTVNATGSRRMAITQNTGLLHNGVLRSPNSFNGLTVLLAVPVIVERVSGNIWSYIGDVPDVRICSINNVNPKDEITIGTDVWKVFPARAKNTTINTVGAGPSSGPYAYAFKKNA